jgi:hypothetical protein
MTEPHESHTSFVSGDRPMPDLFGPAPRPSANANGATAAVGEHGWASARPDAVTSGGAGTPTHESRVGRGNRLVAGGSRSNGRTVSERSAAGGAGGRNRLAGARRSAPYAVATAVLVVAALAVVALPSANDNAVRAPGPEPAQPPDHFSAGSTPDPARVPDGGRVPGPPVRRNPERPALTPPPRERQHGDGGRAPSRRQRLAPPAPPTLPPAPPSTEEVAPPPAPQRPRPVPPARTAPALPAPVPPGSPPEFL